MPKVTSFLSILTIAIAACATGAPGPKPAPVVATDTGLANMAVPGCFSECSAIGTIGGALVLAIKNAYGDTSIKFVDGASLPREKAVPTLPSFDQEFLAAVDTGECVSECIATLLLDRRFAMVYRDAVGGGLVHVADNELQFPSDAVASSDDEPCPDEYVHTLLNCGCLADKKNPGRIIMKVAYLVQQFDCNGQLLDFYHHTDEISYSASAGCLCRFLGDPGTTNPNP